MRHTREDMWHRVLQPTLPPLQATLGEVLGCDVECRLEVTEGWGDLTLRLNMLVEPVAFVLLHLQPWRELVLPPLTTWRNEIYEYRGKATLKNVYLSFELVKREERVRHLTLKFVERGSEHD